jgi:hypothetical protein
MNYIYPHLLALGFVPSRIEGNNVDEMGLGIAVGVRDYRHSIRKVLDESTCLSVGDYMGEGNDLG